MRPCLLLGVSLGFGIGLWSAEGRTQAPAEKPPYQRLLQGDDAKRAVELEATIQQHEAADRYADAIRVAEELLALRRRVQGADHHETVDATWRLDVVRRVAKLTPEQRVAWREAIRGTAKAAALEDQGRFAQALLLWETYLDQCRTVLGEQHPQAASTYHNIASNLNAQGKHGQALPLLQKALDIYRKVLGEEHPYTATSYDNVAFSLNAQGKYAQAEPLFLKALYIFRKVQGEEHSDTANSYNNVASNRNAQGKHAQAEPLNQKALELFRKLLGEEHPLTAAGYNNVASNLGAQGKHAQAELPYQRALDIYRKVLGEEHPNTAISYNNVAGNLYDQGKHDQALPLFQKALDIQRKVKGEEHPGTARSYSSVASNLYAQRKHVQAEPLFQKALDIQRKVLGEEHPHTAQSYNNVAMNLNAQGKHAQAEPLLHKALDIYRKVLGEEHPETAKSYNNFASNLHVQGKHHAAAEMALRATRCFEAARLAGSSAGLGRSLFAAARRSPYPLLASLHAQMDQPLPAWQALEAYLGRGLLDALTSRLPPSLTEEERQQQQRLQRHLAELQPQLLALVRQREATDAQQRRLDDLLQDRTRTAAELADLAVRVAQRELVELTTLQNQLPANAALLAWVDTQDRSGFVQEHWACVVTKSGLPIWARLPGSGPQGVWTREDDSLPNRCRQALADPGGSLPNAEAKVLAAKLYTQRLAPIEPAFQGVSRLIVLPAGQMSALPIEALTDRFTVSYAPSATLFARLTQPRPAADPATARLLTLGDPICKPRLPGSRREVEAIRPLFPQADAHLGSDASEQKLAQMAKDGQLRQYRYVHFATHGEINPERADKCALVLSQDKLPDALAQSRAGGRFYDGKLDVGEILDEWQLDADLVTLSACETGLGQEAGGEGLMGFSQALLSKGARSLLVSLWKVDDTATALLMVRFYANVLGKGGAGAQRQAKAEALREAKAWLRELTAEQVAQASAALPALARGDVVVRKSPAAVSGKPYAHPYWWSAFILIGDPN